MGVILEEELIRRILNGAKIALQRYVTPEGQAVFESSVHIVTGVRPETAE